MINNVHYIHFQGKMLANKKVAWTKIKIPDSVKNGDTLDDWWPLSGELGNEKEGTIHIIFSKKVSFSFFNKYRAHVFINEFMKVAKKYIKRK